MTKQTPDFIVNKVGIPPNSI